MKIFNATQIKEIDIQTLKAQSISESFLIKRVAKEIVDWLPQELLSDSKKVYLFAGPGNNGNDTIAVATLLHQKGVECKLYLISKENDTSQLSSSRKEVLKEYLETTKCKVNYIAEVEDLPSISNEILVIDGIFGTGLNREPEGIFKEVIKAINTSQATVLSIDLPSGIVFNDSYTLPPNNAIRATHTITLEIPKLPLFLKDFYSYTGEWSMIDIGLDKEAINQLPSKYHMIDDSTVGAILKKRARYSHKGDYGHALLIAGSKGMAGAATLSAKGALRAGAGLLTIYTRAELLSIFQTSLPEAICSLIERGHPFLNMELDKYNTAAIGPGLGTSSFALNLLDNFIDNFRKPALFDADALNIISFNKQFLVRIPENSIITPHPGEFARLAGRSGSSMEVLEKQIEFSKRYKLYVVLKGAYTSISTPEGEVWFNSTGNPGMATAGSGDLLTGVIVGLLAQGYPSKESAIAGVFLHSLAADLAVERMGEDSLIASDIEERLGEAFKSVKNRINRKLV